MYSGISTGVSPLRFRFQLSAEYGKDGISKSIAVLLLLLLLPLHIAFTTITIIVIIIVIMDNHLHPTSDAKIYDVIPSTDLYTTPEYTTLYYSYCL